MNNFWRCHGPRKKDVMLFDVAPVCNRKDLPSKPFSEGWELHLTGSGQSNKEIPLVSDR